MIKEEMAERMVDWLTTQHLHSEGGYPYATIWVGDTLVVASALDEEPEIETYTCDELIEWYIRARDYIDRSGLSKEWPKNTSSCFGDWGEAFFETKIDSPGSLAETD